MPGRLTCSSALIIIIIIVAIGLVILSSLSLSPVKLILCSRGGQTQHSLPFHAPILRAINIMRNAYSTKLVSYFFFCFYLALFSGSSASPLLVPPGPHHTEDN